MDEELMRSIHMELLHEIRERERGIWKFWTIIISALGALVSGKYLGKYSPEYEPWLFVLGAVFALILLSWGVGIVLTYGYHYRTFQRVLFNIEKKGCLTGEIIPCEWNPCKKFSKLDLPGLYKVHFWAFSFAIVLVVLSSLWLFPKTTYRYYVLTGGPALSVVALVCLYYYSRRRLRKKMGDICSCRRCEKGDYQTS